MDTGRTRTEGIHKHTHVVHPRQSTRESHHAYLGHLREDVHVVDEVLVWVVHPADNECQVSSGRVLVSAIGPIPPCLQCVSKYCSGEGEIFHAIKLCVKTVVDADAHTQLRIQTRKLPLRHSRNHKHPQTST